MSPTGFKNSEDSKRQDDKSDLEDVEKVASPALDAHYDPVFVKETLRLIDWRMLPLLGLLYAFSLIDRQNLGIARISGMGADLRLDVGERYSIASMVFFFPYILLQIPGNIILRKIGSRTWLVICVLGWGSTQLGMAFVTSWGYLTFCRVLLGVFEAGFFPSLVFIITTWYKRYEVQTRIALFYLCALVISSFSGILGYAINHLAGKAGLNGWQWIFMIEGIITIVLGILTWLFVPDFPDKSRFLTQEQRQMVLDRVDADRGDSIPDEMTWEKLIMHLRDPIVWIIATMFLALTVPGYAIGFFLSIILKGMGYSTSQSLLLTTPPGLFAALSCVFFARVSDKTRLRAPWMALQNVFIIVGLALAAYSSSNPVRYFGLFLAYAGASGCGVGVLAYSANNITSHTKRSVQTAVILGAGGVGGVMATTVFRQVDYPRYVNGMWVTIGLQILMLFLLAITSFVFNRRNRLRREGKLGPLEGQPNFYYTI